MVPPRHGNHTLSFMDHYVTNDSIISSLLLYCHSCQLFMDFPSWAVCRTYLLPCVSDWCFRFLYLALFVTGDEVCQLVSLVSFSGPSLSLSDNDQYFCRFVGDVLPCFMTTCGGRFYSYFLESPDYFCPIYLSVL